MATAKQSADQYRRRLAWAIERLGSQCVRCESTENLQFDHVDPRTKSFNISQQATHSLEALAQELEKCQLLCRECHLAKTLGDKGQRSAVGTHGTRSAYRHCGPPKCDECRRAHAEAHRIWRRGRQQGRVAPQRAPHGTNSGYRNCGPPKCNECKAAHRLAVQQFRRRKK
jgi:hypothetical protein